MLVRTKLSESVFDPKDSDFFNAIGQKQPFVGATRNGCLRMRKRPFGQRSANGRSWPQGDIGDSV